MKPMETEPVAILPLDDEDREILRLYRMLSAGNKVVLLCKAKTAIASQRGTKKSDDRENENDYKIEQNIIYLHPSVWGRTAVV